ncbi:hypothetical protein FRZ03_20190 [Streptomyces misionensis]|uniref:Uncharacterized protein n=1 Tax=Streptomyces misionensis TaxID=67331 RepID=A0A5C6JMR8_9ACTN|nr:hypothetical protein [Streptomyces misionensis]TWV41906.1 hypothetical protein FRZ03_20190 [Streptomyces misionensis]
MDTDTNIRNALDKSVEKLETAGRAAHDKTTKDVVDELGRMRSNFRDIHNRAVGAANPEFAGRDLRRAAPG